jgi:hypothetical protein
LYLSWIAGKIPGLARLLGTIQLLSSLLYNPAIRMLEWCVSIVPLRLDTRLRNLGEIHLIIDGTKIGFDLQLLMDCITFRKRTIPLTWIFIKQIKGDNGSETHRSTGLSVQADP